jgi:hypothetical protein
LAAVLSGRVTLDNALVHVRPHLDVLTCADALSVDDLFMAPEMHALVDSLRDMADIVFIVSGNVHDARSKALIDVADSVILEVVQGVSSYRDLYQASNDFTLVADKLLGVVYVALAVSRGRRTKSSATTNTPMRDTASPGKTASVDPEFGSESETAPIDGTAPTHLTAPIDGTAPTHLTAPIDDTAPTHLTAPIDDTAPDHETAPTEEIYPPPPWTNGAVQRIDANEQPPTPVRDKDLAAPRRAG